MLNRRLSLPASLLHTPQEGYRVQTHDFSDKMLTVHFVEPSDCNNTTVSKSSDWLSSLLLDTETQIIL